MTLELRLAAIRGGAAPKPHDARTLAALTTNPGCRRRAVLDAAGINKDALSRRLGYDPASRMSLFALTRGNTFEEQVKADRYAPVFRVLREVLDLPVPEVAVTDLGEAAGSTSPRVRHARTRSVLSAVARGDAEGAVFDHPLLRLTVGGNPVYLEPDLIAFRIAERFFVVEIKSFPIIDGQAETAAVKAAATQAAAYVVALRALLVEEGLDGDAVSDRAILIGPRNFTSTPVGAMMHLPLEIASLERQLRRLDRIESVLDHLPDGLCLDLSENERREPVRTRAELTEHIDSIPPRYRPTCLRDCGMGKYCRAQARDESSLDVLGPTAREPLGGVETITMALGLADGSREPGPEQVPIAAALRHAADLDSELRGVPWAG